MWFVTITLLTVSNVFMTFAWYGHLRYKATALSTAILISWLIAFVEYCFQVPANRLGHAHGISAAQLKTIQEVITLSVFCFFSVLYLREPLKWNYLVGFFMIVAGALFVFAPWQQHSSQPSTAAASAEKPNAEMPLGLDPSLHHRLGEGAD